MDGSMLQLAAEPGIVGVWYAVGAVGACHVLFGRGAGGDDWSRHRWAWAVTVFFLALIGLFSFKCWVSKQGRVPHSVRVRAHQIAVEWAASSSLGVLAASIVASGLRVHVNDAQEWAMSVAASVACSGVMLATSLSSLSTPWLRPRARDWAVVTLMPITACAWVVTYDVLAFSAIGARPTWHTPAFWGFFAVFVLSVFGCSLPAAWLLTRGGFMMEGSSLQSTRDVLSRHAGPRRLSLMGVAGFGAAAATVWVLQHVTPGREARAVMGTSGLPINVRVSSGLGSGALTPSCSAMGSSSVLAALQEGVAEKVWLAQQALLRDAHRQVSARCLRAASLGASVGAHVAPRSVFKTTVQRVLRAQYALQWNDVAAARGELAKALRALGQAPCASAPASPSSGAQAYRGALVLSTRGEPVGRVTNVDGGSIELGLVGPWRGAMWPWPAYERHLKVHPSSLLFGPVRALGATVVVPNMSRSFGQQ